MITRLNPPLVFILKINFEMKCFIAKAVAVPRYSCVVEFKSIIVVLIALLPYATVVEFSLLTKMSEASGLVYYFVIYQHQFDF